MVQTMQVPRRRVIRPIHTMQPEFEEIKPRVVQVLRQASNSGNIEIDRNAETISVLSKRLFNNTQHGLILITEGVNEKVKDGLRWYYNEMGSDFPLITIRNNSEVENQKQLYSLLHPDLSSEEINNGHRGINPEDYPKLVAIKDWDETCEEVVHFRRMYDSSIRDQQPDNE